MECDDVLVPVGQEAKITARLNLKDVFNLRFRLTGRVISFHVDGEEIGEARTGWEGCATMVFTPLREKEYRLVASCRGADRSPPAVAEATIFSRSTKREALILDIDRTLSGCSTFASMIRGSKRIPPLNDAVEVTRALARKYDPIVVTARKTYVRRKTKRWLAEKGFPAWPIYFSSFFGSPISHERFKTELIRELKQVWRNITIGIGDRDFDARAYLANGLRAIILREKGPCPRGAVMVSNWKSIGKLLLE